MRGWRWIPIHLPFSPSTFVSHNSTNCTSTTYITISILVNYHPLLTVNDQSLYLININCHKIFLNYIVMENYISKGEAKVLACIHIQIRKCAKSAWYGIMYRYTRLRIQMHKYICIYMLYDTVQQGYAKYKTIIQQYDSK